MPKLKTQAVIVLALDDELTNILEQFVYLWSEFTDGSYVHVTLTLPESAYEPAKAWLIRHGYEHMLEDVHIIQLFHDGDGDLRGE